MVFNYLLFGISINFVCDFGFCHLPHQFNKANIKQRKITTINWNNITNVSYKWMWVCCVALRTADCFSSSQQSYSHYHFLSNHGPIFGLTMCCIECEPNAFIHIPSNILEVCSFYALFFLNSTLPHSAWEEHLELFQLEWSFRASVFVFIPLYHPPPLPLLFSASIFGGGALFNVNLLKTILLLIFSQSFKVFLMEFTKQ